MPELGSLALQRLWTTMLSETTTNLLLSGIMGLIGGLITIPINTYFSWLLKKEEIKFQHRLDIIAKKQELLLHHRLDVERDGLAREIDELRNKLSLLEKNK